MDSPKKACPPAQPKWGATPGDESSSSSALADLIISSQEKVCQEGAQAQGKSSVEPMSSNHKKAEQYSPNHKEAEVAKIGAQAQVTEVVAEENSESLKSDEKKPCKSPRTARKSQRDRKAEARSTEITKVKQGSFKLKSPEYQTRKTEETVTGAKRASQLKPNHSKLPLNAEELCNEEDMSILWPILGVNSKGEKSRDPRCPSAKRCNICSSICPEDDEKPQCKACLDPLHRRGCDARKICETARWNTIRKKKELILSSGLSSLEELKEKKLVTMSPYPPNRGSSQPPGGKRTRERVTTWKDQSEPEV